MVARGEVWWAEVGGVRRPVAVVHRQRALTVLDQILVAPATRTKRGIPTEVTLTQADDQMPRDCVLNLDNLTLLDRRALIEPITRLSEIRLAQVCEALRIAIDC